MSDINVLLATLDRLHSNDPFGFFMETVSGHWPAIRAHIARLQAAKEGEVALQECCQWLDENRRRLHSADCTVHIPDARCSCGLHRVLTDLCGVTNDLAAIRERGKP